MSRRPTLLTPAFLAILAATLAYFVSVGMTLPLFPLFVKGPLAGGAVAIGVAAGMFSVAAILVRPFVGRFGDRRGRRLLIAGGAALAGISVAGYAIAESLPVLIGMRVLGGIGEAAFFTGAATAAADLAPDERRGEAVSYFSLGLYVGIAIGPLLGELLVGDDHFARVWLVAGAGMLIAGALGLRVPDTRPEPTGEEGRLIHPAALAPGIVIWASVWGFAAYETFVPLHARDVGLSGARYVFLMYASLIVLVRLFGARIPDAWGSKRTATVSLGSTAIGLGLMAAWDTIAGLYVGTAILALGQSLAFPALMTMAVSRAPASQRAAVVGTFTAFVDLGFGIGPVSAGLAVRLVDANLGAFLAGAAAAVVGLAVLRTRRDAAPGSAPSPPAAVPEVEG